MALQPVGESTGRLWLLAAGYAAGLIFLQQLALLMAPVPVAVFTARRQMGVAWSFVAIAFLAGAVNAALGLVPLGLPNVLFAMIGFVVGWGVRAGRAYRQVVMRAAVMLFMLLAVALSAEWDALEAGMADTLVEVNEQLNGEDSETLSESTVTNLNLMKWFLEHFRFVLFGNAFGAVLVAMCFATTLVYQWLSRFSDIPLAGSFREFKPPDALVWVVIVAALGWLANDRWPQETLQFWSWNLTAGVFVWYWLNGLSLLMYAFAVLKPHPVMALLFTALLLFAGIALLALVGLFDTWGDFRKTIDSRAARKKSDGDMA